MFLGKDYPVEETMSEKCESNSKYAPHIIYSLFRYIKKSASKICKGQPLYIKKYHG